MRWRSMPMRAGSPGSRELVPGAQPEELTRTALRDEIAIEGFEDASLEEIQPARGGGIERAAGRLTCAHQIGEHFRDRLRHVRSIVEVVHGDLDRRLELQPGAIDQVHGLSHARGSLRSCAQEAPE